MNVVVTDLLTKNIETAKRIISVVDLTLLGDADTEQDIVNLCNKALTPIGQVAALCIWQKYIPLAKKTLEQINANVKIATVVNFPYGRNTIPDIISEIKQAQFLGADEIDLVLPYFALKSNNIQLPKAVIRAAREICLDALTLKVILEVSELQTDELIKQVADLAIHMGVDFIKTSTGKTNSSATIEAVTIMLQAIKDTQKPCGIKPSGGIRTVQEAMKYINLTEKFMGKSYINPRNFRIGASSLLDDVLKFAGLTKNSLTENIIQPLVNQY